MDFEVIQEDPFLNNDAQTPATVATGGAKDTNDPRFVSVRGNAVFLAELLVLQVRPVARLEVLLFPCICSYPDTPTPHMCCRCAMWPAWKCI